MCQTVFPIVFPVVISHTCTPAIFTQAPKSQGLSRLYEAIIDVSRTSNRNPRRSAVGVVGNSEGFILKTVWSNNFIPAVLTHTRMKICNSAPVLNLPKLQVYVIATTSPERFLAIMGELTIWWDNEAHFLKLNATPDTKYQSSNIDKCPYAAFEEFGVLDAQLICLDRTMNVWIFKSNRFACRTPKFWEFLPAHEKIVPAFSVLKRIYRNRGQNCESLNFAKTVKTGGYAFYLLSRWSWLTHRVTNKFNKLFSKVGGNLVTLIEYVVVRNVQFVIDSIAIGLKASTLLMENSNNIIDVITFDSSWISTNGLFGVSRL